jgi:hypothetical protein
MSVRLKILQTTLTEPGMAKEMARVFPKRNNFGVINYRDLLQEASAFGITTRGAFRSVLLRHRKRVLRIDREPIDQLHIRVFSDDYGYDRVRDLLRRQFWFSWEAFVRISFELEFGLDYEEFSSIRDGF